MLLPHYWGVVVMNIQCASSSGYNTNLDIVNTNSKTWGYLIETRRKMNSSECSTQDFRTLLRKTMDNCVRIAYSEKMPLYESLYYSSFEVPDNIRFYKESMSFASVRVVGSIKTPSLEILSTGGSKVFLLYKGRQLELHNPATMNEDCLRILINSGIGIQCTNKYSFLEALSDPQFKKTRQMMRQKINARQCPEQLNFNKLNHYTFLDFRNDLATVKRMIELTGVEYGESSTDINPILERLGSHPSLIYKLMIDSLIERRVVSKDMIQHSLTDIANSTVHTDLFEDDDIQESNQSIKSLDRLLNSDEDYEDLLKPNGDLEVWVMSSGFYQLFKFGLITHCSELKNLLDKGISFDALFAALKGAQNADAKLNEVPRMFQYSDMSVLRLVI